MPELPDVEVYVSALGPRVVGEKLLAIRLASPFLLRTVEPSLPSFFGQTVQGVRRIGKRIALVFPAERFLVVHLMIAGRFQWKREGELQDQSPICLQHLILPTLPMQTTASKGM